jgi:signal peptidase I
MSDEIPAVDTQAQQQQPRPGKSGIVRARGCVIEILETLLLTVIIFFVVQHFVAQPYRIFQVSMERTLEPDQMVLVDKLSPVFSDYKRGDVIVFNPPLGFQDQGSDPFIKRVIGVGGDLVEVHDGAVWVNGAKLTEPYVYDGQPTAPRTEVTSWRVPDGQLFVMGDHRDASEDSRVFGPIQKSSVIGRAWIRYWPTSSLSIVEQVHYDNVPNPSPAPSK